MHSWLKIRHILVHCWILESIVWCLLLNLTSMYWNKEHNSSNLIVLRVWGLTPNSAILSSLPYVYGSDSLIIWDFWPIPSIQLIWCSLCWVTSPLQFHLLWYLVLPPEPSSCQQIPAKQCTPDILGNSFLGHFRNNIYFNIWRIWTKHMFLYLDCQLLSNWTCPYMY